MRYLTLVLALLALPAMAQSEDRGARGGPHNASAVLSFAQGGLSFGAGYEYMAQDSIGIGGHFRWFNKEDGPRNASNGYMIIGASAAHHFYKKNWDLSFAPSFNLINIDNASATQDDGTTLGPGLSLSLLCALTDNVAMGFDWSNYWVWFDSDFAGKRIDDLGVKLRMSF